MERDGGKFDGTKDLLCCRWRESFYVFKNTGTQRVEKKAKKKITLNSTTTTTTTTKTMKMTTTRANFPDKTENLSSNKIEKKWRKEKQS